MNLRFPSPFRRGVRGEGAKHSLKKNLASSLSTLNPHAALSQGERVLKVTSANRWRRRLRQASLLLRLPLPIDLLRPWQWNYATPESPQHRQKSGSPPA